MLKWLVTGRDGGEAVVDPVSSQTRRSIAVINTEDPLAAAVGCNSDNNNYNLFKVNRLGIKIVFRFYHLNGRETYVRENEFPVP